MTISTEMSDKRKQKAREYATIKRTLYFIELGITLVLLLILLFTGLSLGICKLVEGWTSEQFLVVPLYMLIFGLFFGVVSFPLSLYSGFYLPRKYGKSHQTLGGWLADAIKGLVIGGIIGMLLIELLYLGLRTSPDWWWLIGGIFYLFFTVVMANLVPVLIMPLFNKFTPLDNDELRDRLLRLADRTGAKVKGVYTMDFSRRTNDANAFVTGLGNTRRIVLGDTLTDNFTSEEIEVVMAHELGHYNKSDIWRLIIVDSVVTLVGLFIVNLILQNSLSSFGYRSLGDVAAFPLFALVLVGFSLLTQPLINAFSRSRETAADVYALDITHNATSFISSMKKLANQNLADTEPPTWVVWFFYTHPPIGERVRRGEAFARQHGLNPYPEG